MTLLLFFSSACFRPSPWTKLVASARLCYPIGMALVQAHILCSSSPTRQAQPKHQQHPASICTIDARLVHNTIHQLSPNSTLGDPTTTAEMAGGKGKSSGGKSSGGKVGADGSKKQQSHSSKAGLQVSLTQPPTHISPKPQLLLPLHYSGVCGEYQSRDAIASTPPCRVSMIPLRQRQPAAQCAQCAMRPHRHSALPASAK
jgi:hypothetical protein